MAAMLAFWVVAATSAALVHGHWDLRASRIPRFTVQPHISEPDVTFKQEIVRRQVDTTQNLAKLSTKTALKKEQNTVSSIKVSPKDSPGTYVYYFSVLSNPAGYFFLPYMLLTTVAILFTFSLFIYPGCIKQRSPKNDLQKDNCITLLFHDDTTSKATSSKNDAAIEPAGNTIEKFPKEKISKIAKDVNSYTVLIEKYPENKGNFDANSKISEIDNIETEPTRFNTRLIWSPDILFEKSASKPIMWDSCVGNKSNLVLQKDPYKENNFRGYLGNFIEDILECLEQCSQRHPEKDRALLLDDTASVCSSITLDPASGDYLSPIVVNDPSPLYDNISYRARRPTTLFQDALEVINNRYQTKLAYLPYDISSKKLNSTCHSQDLESLSKGFSTSRGLRLHLLPNSGTRVSSSCLLGRIKSPPSKRQEFTLMYDHCKNLKTRNGAMSPRNIFIKRYRKALHDRLKIKKVTSYFISGDGSKNNIFDSPNLYKPFQPTSILIPKDFTTRANKSRIPLKRTRSPENVKVQNASVCKEQDAGSPPNDQAIVQNLTNALTNSNRVGRRKACKVTFVQ